MRTVRVAQTFPGTVPEAERCWFDTARWDHWIDGLERVVAVDRDWPNAGSAVTWQSNPAGRGRVTERVMEREPLEGQTLEVQDDSIRGRQSVAFTPVEPGVEVALTLEYEIKRRSIVTPVIDLLFIRRAMTVSLQTTVSRFGVELRSARADAGS
ncbi:MAG TPA: SRPBCC family protein [Solirubrobacteraceae bacterium]|jgi:hypothetical protein